MPHFPKPFFKKARGLWYVEIDRRQINLGPDREVAFRMYHQLMSQTNRKGHGASEFLVDIVDSFLEWVSRNRSPDTYEWYRYRLQRFVERYPKLTVRDLRPFHVQEWVDSYPGLSKTSRRNYFRSVKRCMKWAMQQGYISENPVAYLEVPGGDRKEVIVTTEEYARILEHCKDVTFRDLVVVTWETGCRPQELLRVEARHVDLRNSRWILPQSEAKGKKAPRIVYLSETAVEITSRLQPQYPTGKLFRNSRGDAWTPDAVNCGFDRIQDRMGQEEMNRRGESITAEQIAAFIPKLKPTKVSKGKPVDKTAAELRAEAKRKLKKQRIGELVPRYSLYALRHSWATRALQSGLDGLTVAVLMGHSDPSTLARVYQHLAHDPEHLLKQARRAAG